MASDLIALRQWFRSRPWAMDPRELATYHETITSATDVTTLAPPRVVAATSSRRLVSPSGRAIGVLPVMGPISARASIFSEIFGGAVITSLQAQFRDLEQDPSVSGIVLLLDSPGGEVGLVQELAAELRAGTKPLLAAISPLAASAAYWLASAADQIAITPSGSAGSIGVYLVHLDFSRQLEAAGVTPTVISAGAGKVDGNPLEPLSAAARAEIQGRVDEVYGAFVQDVARGRSRLTSTAIRNTLGAGVYGAADAVRLGLADRVATSEDAVASAVSGRSLGAARANVDDRRIADEHQAILVALAR